MGNQASKLPLGRILGTRLVREQVPNAEVAAALARHENCDWGDMHPLDRIANDQALLNGDRIISVHRTKAGVVFWIITEADRATTTLLLPSEY